MDEKIQAVVGALKQFKKVQRPQRARLNLFDDEPVRILVSAIKVEPASGRQMVKIPLPRAFRAEQDVCLFVKDLERGIRVDHERSTQHWQKILQQAGVTSVTKVMPLRELKAEYSSYEARRKLCDSYHVFIADVNIGGVLHQYLGKHFYKRHKLPVTINMASKNLSKTIDNCLNTAVLHIYNTGPVSSTQIGFVSQSDDDLLLNIGTAIDVLNAKFPGGLRNIRAIHIKLPRSPALPVYQNSVSSNLVPCPAVRRRPWLLKSAVVDELSTTHFDSDVIVYPNGNVTYVRKDDNANASHDADADEVTEKKSTIKKKNVKTIKKRSKPNGELLKKTSVTHIREDGTDGETDKKSTIKKKNVKNLKKRSKPNGELLKKTSVTYARKDKHGAATGEVTEKKSTFKKKDVKNLKKGSKPTGKLLKKTSVKRK